MQQEHIDAGKAIQKRTGKTFYLATRFLPRRVREPTHILYGFFRTADEVVDDPGDASPDAQRARLAELRAQALGRTETDDPVLTAFRSVRRRFGIPDEVVEEFLDAMRTDVHTDRYETYADLEAYMRGSASAVGVMMTAIMDPDDREAALPHAVALGEAFQLTNFLRDVREDARDRDRIYLPREILRAHDVTTEEVASLEYSPRFAAAMAALEARTEARYRDGVAGIRYLPADCQLPVVLAAVLYAEHHRLIREREYDVLSDRPSLSTGRKLRCLLRTRWHWQWTDDPAVAFRRASAIPPAESGRDRPELAHEKSAVVRGRPESDRDRDRSGSDAGSLPTR